MTHSTKSMARYKKAILAATAGASLLVTAACGGSDTASTDTSGSTSQSSSAPSSSSGSSDTSSSSYKAGDYDESGSYQNPGGTSEVDVKLSLESDGTVSALTVTPEASGTSLQYQQKFVSGINDEVVGKSIDELNVSKVAGSSLTSQGFNAAIDEIKADARA